MKFRSICRSPGTGRAGGSMPTPSPTVRRKRLSIELRRLREQAGLTCEDVGQRLECSGTRISRMETGRISARPGDVRELLEIYGVTGAEADSLVQLARDARRKGWWHSYGRALPTWFEAYIGMESEAARLRDFQPLVVPGLLQTEGYARAVLRAAPYAGRSEDIDRQVALRIQRQAILGQASPPVLAVVPSCETSCAGSPTRPHCRTSRSRCCRSARRRTCRRSARSPCWSSPIPPTRPWCTPSTSPAACSWTMRTRSGAIGWFSTTCAPKLSAPASRSTLSRRWRPAWPDHPAQGVPDEPSIRPVPRQLAQERPERRQRRPVHRGRPEPARDRGGARLQGPGRHRARRDQRRLGGLPGHGQARLTPLTPTRCRSHTSSPAPSNCRSSARWRTAWPARAGGRT